MMSKWTVDKVRVYPKQAIAEIERLREALEKIADEKYSDCAWDADDFHRVARAALEGE